MARTKEFEPEEKLIKARDLFWEKGYSGTSMQDLVEAMGLNRGSIYDTFGDKHSLFLQSLSNYAEEILKEYTNVATTVSSPLKAIEQILSGNVKKAFVNGKNSCMSVKCSLELASDDKSVQHIIQLSGCKITKVFEELIIKGQEAGEIKEQDAKMLANFVGTYFSGLWQSYIVTGDKQLIQNQITFLISMIKK
ncbi:TetR/AcrR family transcriptional regulator [Flavobacterium kingsejongi]|uniref:TetR family transcriptional regulator n=1 Tax=Flavobacterium kingsejongi TaxID=1678728 RepID=A0A2S1LSW9_9FLAO|nr:TetR/AcrR family transcriptional regulator [Flavobacterium kingsejongi]AWG26772.1 TetR family transcriptional regulator [Flavobacterium kingsejongi]